MKGGTYEANEEAQRRLRSGVGSVAEWRTRRAVPLEKGLPTKKRTARVSLAGVPESSTNQKGHDAREKTHPNMRMPFGVSSLKIVQGPPFS